MVYAIASSLITLACQGCVATGADYASYEPAVAPSLGMTLAVPGSFGDGALNAPTGNAFAGSPVEISTPVPTGIRLTAPDAPVGVVATVPPPSAFSLTGSGVVGAPDPGANLGWSANPAAASVAAQLASRRYGQPDAEYNDLSLGVSIAATSRQTGLGFDVGVAPRVGLRDGSDMRGRSLGGELRFGQGLDLADGPTPKGWYVFVGADGEALVWDTELTNLGMNTFTDVQMTDQITVGDLQAGFSIQRAGGELSLSYIRREIEFSDRNKTLQDTEDFAGITFTMRR